MIENFIVYLIGPHLSIILCFPFLMMFIPVMIYLIDILVRKNRKEDYR
jgi:hypothetical protein